MPRSASPNLLPFHNVVATMSWRPKLLGFVCKRVLCLLAAKLYCKRCLVREPPRRCQHMFSCWEKEYWTETVDQTECWRKSRPNRMLKLSLYSNCFSSIFLLQFTIILEISCLTSTFCLADICVHFLVCFNSSKWQRPVGCLIFIFHSPQKSPIIIGSFAEKDLQHKASHASSPPCITPHSILSH